VGDAGSTLLVPREAWSTKVAPRQSQSERNVADFLCRSEIVIPCLESTIQTPRKMLPLANPSNSYLTDATVVAGISHDNAARVLLLCLGVEHLARCAQVVRLCDKIVEFFACRIAVSLALVFLLYPIGARCCACQLA